LINRDSNGNVNIYLYIIYVLYKDVSKEIEEGQKEYGGKILLICQFLIGRGKRYSVFMFCLGRVFLNQEI